MIYVRNDDVLIQSSSWDDPLGRLKQIHGWICESDRFLHIPAVLVTEIQEFPEAIEFISEETAEGRMLPELHGLTHIDYAKLSESEIIDQLSEGKDWMQDKFGLVPNRFFSPWGGNAEHMYTASAACDLELIDCSRINKMNGRHGIVQRLKDGESIDYLEDDYIFSHWWQGGARLKRIIEVAKHGSWEAAAEANRELFK